MASTCLLGPHLEGLLQILSSIVPSGLHCNCHILPMLPVRLHCVRHILSLHSLELIQGESVQAGRRGVGPGLQRDGMVDHGLTVREDILGIGQDDLDLPDDSSLQYLQTAQPSTCSRASSSTGVSAVSYAAGPALHMPLLLQTAVCTSVQRFARHVAVAAVQLIGFQPLQTAAHTSCSSRRCAGDSLMVTSSRRQHPAQFAAGHPQEASSQPDPPGRLAVHDGGVQRLQTAAQSWTANLTSSSCCGSRPVTTISCSPCTLQHDAAPSSCSSSDVPRQGAAPHAVPSWLAPRQRPLLKAEAHMWSTCAGVEICTDAGLLHLGALRDQAQASWKRLMEAQLVARPCGAFVSVNTATHSPEHAQEVFVHLQNRAQPCCIIHPALFNLSARQHAAHAHGRQWCRASTKHSNEMWTVGVDTSWVRRHSQLMGT